jgi:hypothetical protein
VFSYGCHPVIVYGFAWEGISADFVGAARRALRDELGEHVHCQFIQGLAGNVRPRVLADNEAGMFRPSALEDRDKAGRTLAGDVAVCLDREGQPLRPSLAAVSGWIHPQRALERAPSVTFWRDMAGRDDELSRNVGSYWARQMASGKPLAPVLPMEIGMLQIAPGHRIAWFNTEAVAEWLPLLRSWLADSALTCWGYCQEVSTYLPTDVLLSEGGYEVINAPWYDVNGPAPFAAGIEQTVREGFEALAQRLT